jgi:putative transposase
MQRLHGHYAQFLNGRHRRVGHVFQGRYGAVRMTSDGQLCAAAAYIARNPVEAGLGEHPGQWPWSSFRGVNGEATPNWVDLDRLLSYFGTQRDEARRRYEEMSTTAPVSLDGV